MTTFSDYSNCNFLIFRSLITDDLYCLRMPSYKEFEFCVNVNVVISNFHHINLYSITTFKMGIFYFG